MSRPHGALFGMNLLGKKGLGNKMTEARSYYKWRKKYVPKLRAFKNKHAGEDCFIIGNGPSLKQMDLSVLADYHTFGLNKIFLMEDLGVDLDLSYLVSVNALVIEQSAEKFAQMNCPIFLDYNASEGTVEEKDHINRLHTLNVWSFYEDLTQPICQGYTVTFVAMQIAYYMGFKRVFLIGVDHSFKQQGKSNEVQTYEGNDENHFHPDYFKGQQWQLADVYGSEVSYHLANYHYLKAERQIFDATVGGQLDVFPKVDFQQALAEAKKK